MNDFKAFTKRPVALLEVLIAFAIVALCILPLIYPHIYILRSEKAFISTVELDHLASHLYANLLQKLYQNEIPWERIESGEEIPIDDSLLKSAGFSGDLPFKGTYRFVKDNQKPKKPVDKAAYIFKLIFTFKEKPGYFLKKEIIEPGKEEKQQNSDIIYEYLIPMERKIQ